MNTSINITTNDDNDDDVYILLVNYNSDWITITDSFGSRKYIPLYMTRKSRATFSHIRMGTKQNVGGKTQP